MYQCELQKNKAALEHPEGPSAAAPSAQRDILDLSAQSLERMNMCYFKPLNF